MINFVWKIDQNSYELQMKGGKIPKLKVSCLNSAVQKSLDKDPQITSFMPKFCCLLCISCLGWHLNYCIEENVSMGHFIPRVLDALASKAHRKIMQVITSTIPSAFSGRETSLGSWLQLCCLNIEINAHNRLPSILGDWVKGRSLAEIGVLTFSFCLKPVFISKLQYRDEGFLSDTCAS